MRWYKLFTTGDKVLIIFILIFSLLSIKIIDFLKTEGEFVIIEVDNIMKHQLLLSKDTQITVEGIIGKTIIEIKQKCVNVIDSDCPAHICVKSSVIKQAGDIIVCAPNKVAVYIIGNNQNNFNVITE